jgi:hypothetical protein
VLLTDLHPYQVDESNANAAIYATVAAKGPAESFQKRMNQLGLTNVIKMLRPWPVQRLASPEAFVDSFPK